jgi:tetratricopeptide (TPR) repeat protein
VTHQVFISYSTKDTAVAEAVRDGLEDGTIGCWMAPRDIPPGTSWAAAIDRAIRASRLLVLVLSSHANSSPQVVREVCNAVEHGVGLIPFRIQDILPSGAMKHFLSTVHWFDALTPPLEDHISRLVENATRLLAQQAEAERPRIRPVVLPVWTTADVSLIGREREMGQLHDAWAKAHGGLAQAALVSGEAGTGKTRLVQDFVTLQAGAGARWLASRTTAGDLALPYSALEQALRPVVEEGVIPDVPSEHLAEVAHSLPELARLRPGLPTPRELEPEQARAWRQRAWATFLVALARQAPIVLHLDDLQWIDPTSLDCIRYLLMQYPRGPVFVIASLRTEGGKPERHIREFRTELHRRDLLTEISLGPLSEDETYELLRVMSGMPRLPRFSRRLYQHTEGNPFFLLETIQTLFAKGTLFKDERGRWATAYDDFAQDYSELPLPDTVSDLMEPRLEGLDSQSRTFLDVAAVVGRTFDPFMVQQISGLDRRQFRAAVDALVTRGLIRAEHHTCEFALGLLREIVYRDLHFLDCLEFHEKVGEALQRSVGETPSPSEIEQLAHHFRMAELWEPAFKYQLQAGLSAWSVFEAHAARRYLERAKEIAETELHGRIPEGQQLAYLKGLGDVYANLGPYDQALAYYQQVLQMVEGDPTQMADVCWKIAAVHERQPQHDKAIQWLDRGLDAIGDDGDPAILSRLYMHHGLISFKQGRLEDAFDWATKALIFESAQAHNLLAVLHRARGELEVALSHCDQCIELSDAAGDLINLSKGYTNRGVILDDMDRLSEAVRDWERALELLIDTGDAYVHAMTLSNLAHVRRHLGDLDAAYRYAKTALEESLALESDFDIALAHLNLGETLIDQGEPRRARIEHLEVGLDHLQKHEIWDLLSQAERDIAQSFLREGRLDEAEEAARRALEAASEPLSWTDLGAAQRILGQVTHQQGRFAEGEDLLRQSLETLREHGPRYELARTYLALGTTLASAADRRAEAREALDQAGTIFQELGAKLDIEKTNILLSQLASGSSQHASQDTNRGENAKVGAQHAAPPEERSEGNA